ncbi:major facilitator superfamily domain-containing protein [Umbelopsis sp. PMI_123]|nr:major facilitator superfamily domain-containing protein [Umbelopsis sp. PMI_123]
MEHIGAPDFVRVHSDTSDANTMIEPCAMENKIETTADQASVSTICDISPSPIQPAEVQPAEIIETPRQRLRKTIFQILQCFFTVSLMGLQDGNFGVILPRLKEYYSVSDSLISILFLLQAGGYFVMAFANGYVVSKITQKGALYLGCGMLFVGYIILLFGFPFPVICVTMIVVGGGLSLLNAGCNVYIITAPYTTTVLNLLHACYGIGATIGPLMSSSLLAHNLSWKVSYMILAGLSGLSFLGMYINFRKAEIEVHSEPMPENSSEEGETSVQKDSIFKQVYKQRVTQVCAFFLLFYVGTEVTFGSWSFSFLTEVRGGNPVQLGQITSGYWAGLTFGRIFLGAITARFGEKRMVTLYLIISCAMIILIWQATPIAVDLSGLVILGMALGPIFPTTVSMVSQILPKYLHTTTIGFLVGLGQGGAALFPFVNGQIASKAGVIGMMPFTLALTIAMLASWIFMPNNGATMNVYQIYRQRKLKKNNRTADIESNIVVCEKV